MAAAVSVLEGDGMLREVVTLSGNTKRVPNSEIEKGYWLKLRWPGS